MKSPDADSRTRGRKGDAAGRQPTRQQAAGQLVADGASQVLRQPLHQRAGSLPGLARRRRIGRGGRHAIGAQRRRHHHRGDDLPGRSISAPGHTSNIARPYSLDKPARGQANEPFTAAALQMFDSSRRGPPHFFRPPGGCMLTIWPVTRVEFRLTNRYRAANLWAATKPVAGGCGTAREIGKAVKFRRGRAAVWDFVVADSHCGPIWPAGRLPASAPPIMVGGV